MDKQAFTYLADLCALTTKDIYLVGGSVRDLLLGTGHLKDIDLLMREGSETVSKAFADRINGNFFFLDPERKITRVVRHDTDGAIQFDFTNFEGPDLAADLARRDFTVNAMALDLRGFLADRSLDSVVDHFDGRGDIRRKSLRVADPRVLDDDPLRLIRAARFSATLGFTIEKATADEIRKRADLITRPSPERVRDELFQLLSIPGAGRHLLLLESLGLLTKLLPELKPLKDFAPGKHHLYDIFTHSLRTAAYVDDIVGGLEAISPEHARTVREHLDEQLEQFVPRAAALRFACLLHDNAKAEAYSRDEAGDIHFFGHDHLGADKALFICQRFRLSNDTSSFVSRLIRHHMRPLTLSMPAGPSKRALYRYCRDLRDAVPESIILSLSDAKATSEVMTADGFTDTHRTAAVILEYYYGKFLKTEARPFVTGKDLIARGMQPGPEFRDILEGIRERQAEGLLRDREEALAYLATLKKGR
jgi:tRNA nucleotidyltransferase/poly(A) polymerase